jgi:hypothetical protein
MVDWAMAAFKVAAIPAARMSFLIDIIYLLVMMLDTSCEQHA